jgi:NADH:ubiquinone oxidoreductase subunit 2 (subunit N)
MNAPLILVFLLKLGILPFHQLTADLYDGISTKIMMIIQIPVKLGIFLFLIKNFSGTMPITTPILLCATLAIIIPAISTQYSYTFKRFMA